MFEKYIAAPENRRFFVCLSVILLVFCWRTYISNVLNLIPDECSYWAWSRRLDWSYFDNSGMTAYLIRLSTWLVGKHTPFIVRLPFLLLSFFTTYLIYDIGRILFKDNLQAIVTAMVFNITPIALLGASLAMHDNALVFFWTAALWGCARLIQSDDTRWFYPIGLFAGLSIQSKFTGVLVVFAVFIFLLFSKKYRKMLISRNAWIGVAIAALLTAPIVCWNYNHDWISVYHILYIGSGARNLARRLSDGLAYNLAQFVLISPLFYLFVLRSFLQPISECCSFATLRRWMPTRGKIWTYETPAPRAPTTPELLLLIAFSSPLLFFAVMSFKGHVEANWALMGYVAAGLYAVNRSWEYCPIAEGFWRWSCDRIFSLGTLLAVVPVIIVVAHAWVGLVPTFVESKIAKEDRLIWETRGWDGLGRHVLKLVAENDIIAADSYQLAALLEFNVPGNPYVKYLAPWKRPTQFDVWEPSYDNLEGRNILFVSPIPLKKSSNVLTTIFENAAKVEELEPYSFIYHGASIRKMRLYRLINFDPFQPRRLAPKSLFYTKE